MEGTLRFLCSVSGVLRTHGAATLVHLLRARRTGNNDAHRVTGLGLIGHIPASANRDMEHTHSMQHVHVSRETRRRPHLLTNSACLSHVHWARTLLPFTISSCPVERPGEVRKRGDASDVASVPMTRSMRLLRGHRRGRAQESRTRIGPHYRQGNADVEVDARTMGYALHPPPMTDSASLVSRETCRRLQPHSIPAHTDMGLMTGEGTRCQPGERRLSVYEPGRPVTHLFSYGSDPPRSRGTPSQQVSSP